jgi:hypothetical protein
MSHAQHPLPAHCPNCRAAVHGPYCAQCGQETDNALPTLHEFLHEYLHHYVALEGKLLHSIRLLLLPGQLTLEYLAGRRKRYVRPLPLYVTFSFLFFLALSLSQSDRGVRVLADDSGKTVVTREATLGDVAQALHQSAGESEKEDPGVAKTLTVVGNTLDALDRSGRADTVRDQLLHRLPYAVFVLMPVFAGLCALAYRGRHQTYGVHLLFTLHLHAFLFLLFLLALVPGIRVLDGWLPLAMLAYLIVALKRVYGRGWWNSAWRGAVLFCVYALLTGITVAGVAIASTELAIAG